MTPLGRVCPWPPSAPAGWPGAKWAANTSAKLQNKAAGVKAKHGLGVKGTVKGLPLLYANKAVTKVGNGAKKVQKKLDEVDPKLRSVDRAKIAIDRARELADKKARAKAAKIQSRQWAAKVKAIKKASKY